MRNVRAVVQVINALAKLALDALSSGADVSDADFAGAMSEYDEAKERLNELDGGAEVARKPSGGGD